MTALIESTRRQRSMFRLFGRHLFVLLPCPNPEPPWTAAVSKKGGLSTSIEWLGLATAYGRMDE